MFANVNTEIIKNSGHPINLVLMDFDFQMIEYIFCNVLYERMNIIAWAKHASAFEHCFEEHFPILITYFGHADRTTENFLWTHFFQRCMSRKKMKMILSNKTADFFIHFDGSNEVKYGNKIALCPPVGISDKELTMHVPDNYAY